MPTPVGYTKNTPASNPTSVTWARSCAVGNTIVLAVQHMGTNQCTVTDNSAGTNTWTKIDDSFSYSTPATSERRVDLWICVPTVAITSITCTSVGLTATYWVLQALDYNGSYSVRSHNKYFGATSSQGAISVTSGDIALALFGYAATTGGTDMVTMSGWTELGFNNISNVQSDLWTQTVATTGTLTPSYTLAATLGLVTAALTNATNAAPVVSAGPTLDIVAGASASFTSTGTDDVSVTSASASFTTLPPGVSAPALTGSATGTGTASAALNQTATLVTPGLYVWTPVYSDGTLTGQASQSAYVSAAAGTYADPQAVVLGANTNVGGAATPLAAISDTNPATYLEGASGSPLRATLPPLPLGPITIEDSALWAVGAVTRTLALFMADGTTVVSTTSYALTNAEVATAWVVPDASNLVTTVPLRRALILQSQDA